MSYDNESDQIIAINDEQAHIFFVNTGDGSIIKDIDFGKKGDYEGVEKVGNVIYAVKSNGNLYGFDLSTQSSSKTMKTALNPSNDIEGLAYNPSSHSLILACKGNSLLNKIELRKSSKSFYAFSLKDKALITEPAFTLTDESLLNCWNELTANMNWSQSKIKKRRKRVTNFSPSAIAFHPISNDVYILSSVGNLMVVIGSFW